MQAIASFCRYVGLTLGALLAMMVLMFWIGEGGPNLVKASMLMRLQFACFLLVPAALLAAWRWELAGGIISVLATVAFGVLHHAQKGGWPHGPIFTTMWIPGALLIVSALLRLRRTH